jgi:hypothetical protein
MSRPQRVAGLVTALLIAAAATAPAGAGAAQKYRFKFTTKLHMDWQWPGNPDNNGRRDSQAYEVLGGKGCGTSPGRAVWKIVYETPDSGLSPSTLKIDLIHVPKNPAKVVDARYGGDASASVQGYLKFGRTKATLSAVAHGDVVGLEFSPNTATITRSKVRKC